MRIDRILGVFHCFSCGYKGSLLQHYKIDYSASSMKREQLLKKISDLRTRGIGLEMPQDYIPYAGNYRGISPSTYSQFNAFKHHAKQFNGRINFPITDVTGRIIGFQGRDELGVLDQKYQFHPSGIRVPLFPSNAVPINGRVLLVEGLFDMLNLWDKGLTNAICCFGTKGFTEEKFNFLKISGVIGLDIFFDPDEAGRQGVQKIKDIVGTFPVREINFKSDPGELQQKTVDSLRKKLYP